MKVELLTPADEFKWDEFLQVHDNATVFHTLEWRNVIQKVYGFTPLYYTAVDRQDEIVGLAPTFYANSILFGRKMFSTPFNFYNGPLWSNEDALVALVEQMARDGVKKQVKYVELKFMRSLDERLSTNLGLVLRPHYFISTLELEADYDATVKKYKKQLRQNLRTCGRKAEQRGIAIRSMERMNDLRSFYGVLAQMYRDKHHMIPQPYSLFRELFETFSAKNMFRLLVAKCDGNVIGGMLLLFFKKKAVYAWGASDSSFGEYSISSLLIDAAVKLCCERRCETLDFGVTSPYQEGLLFFKERWGTTRSKLPYYYALIKSRHVPDLDYYRSYRTLRQWFRYVPLSLVRWLAPFATRHLA
jgi:predicted N-acyltransferase